MNEELLKTQGAKRSSKWPALRKQFLNGKSCAVCGGKKKLEAHHKKPFHLFPALELDCSNLIALCEGAGAGNHHLVFGHYENFSLYNSQVVKDSMRWMKARK